MRSWKNWAIGALGLVVVVLVIALAAGQSGGSGSQVAKATPDGSQSSEEQALARGADATATSTPEATPTPDPDADNDGVADDVDYAPHNRKIQTKADAQDCNVLGINSIKLREGACTEGGAKLKVVNKDTTLTLPQLSAHYNGYTTASTISSDVGSEAANGTFIIVSLTITNRTDSPVSVEPDGFLLTLTPKNRTKTYTHDFDAENEPGSSFVWNSDELQPDQSQTGTVVYDVPTKYASEIARSGNLEVLQFSDASAFSDSPEKRVGIIRTYN